MQRRVETVFASLSSIKRESARAGLLQCAFRAKLDLRSLGRNDPSCKFGTWGRLQVGFTCRTNAFQSSELRRSGTRPRLHINSISKRSACACQTFFSSSVFFPPAVRNLLRFSVDCPSSGVSNFLGRPGPRSGSSTVSFTAAWFAIPPASSTEVLSARQTVITRPY